MMPGDLMSDDTTAVVTQALSDEDRARLAECEAAVEAGLDTFVEVGLALFAIRDGRLYREAHPTFEIYCRDRWELSVRHINRTIQAAETVIAMGPTGPEIKNEAQARELAKVPEANRAAVWQEVLERTGGKPTAAVIAEVRKERESVDLTAGVVTPIGDTGRSSEPSAGAGVGPAPADSSPQQDDEPEGVTAAEDEREDTWPDVPTPGGVVDSATPGNATGEAPADEDPAQRYRSWRSSARAALDTARGELRLVTGDFLEPGTVAERADEPLLIALEQLSRELDAFIAAVRELRTPPVVWIAAARQGVEFHDPLPGGGTKCGRSTRTGSIRPLMEVVEGYDGKPCARCWPAGGGEGHE